MAMQALFDNGFCSHISRVRRPNWQRVLTGTSFEIPTQFLSATDTLPNHGELQFARLTFVHGIAVLQVLKSIALRTPCDFILLKAVEVGVMLQKAEGLMDWVFQTAVLCCCTLRACACELFAASIWQCTALLDCPLSLLSVHNLPLTPLLPNTFSI